MNSSTALTTRAVAHVCGTVRPILFSRAWKGFFASGTSWRASDNQPGEHEKNAVPEGFYSLWSELVRDQALSHHYIFSVMRSRSKRLCAGPPGPMLPGEPGRGDFAGTFMTARF